MDGRDGRVSWSVNQRLHRPWRRWTGIFRHDAPRHAADIHGLGLTWRLDFNWRLISAWMLGRRAAEMLSQHRMVLFDGRVNTMALRRSPPGLRQDLLFDRMLDLWRRQLRSGPMPLWGICQRHGLPSLILQIGGMVLWDGARLSVVRGIWRLLAGHRLTGHAGNRLIMVHGAIWHVCVTVLGWRCLGHVRWRLRDPIRTRTPSSFTRRRP